eukprot:TRINITY_DN12459_c0_g2_i6.p1 TRINITY_DN12459_c0_g2~~TRINITY_DN12459_c0_g2_i6.p1  ORF type:complete len:231 (+),score=22.66 TRINITY_DN12459_c0_g2_i6:164-856(+)
MFDPSIVFTTGVLLVPLIYVDDVKGGIGYLTQPSILLSFALLAIVLYLTHWTEGKNRVLSPRDQRVANWFLCNGVFFNLFLDVIAGQFQMMGEMSKQYLIVEPRYKHGLYEEAGVSVFMTSMCELFFQAPICLLVYWSYHRNKPYRRVLEIVVCILHVCGVWFFYVPEALRGFPHVKADYGFSFSFHMLLYYWFGFWFCGLLWVILPLTILCTAAKELSHIVEKYDRKVE